MVQRGDRLHPLPGEVALQGGERGAQAVEVGLSLVGRHTGLGLPGGAHVPDGRLGVTGPPDAGPADHPGEVGLGGRHAGEQDAQPADILVLLLDALPVRGQEAELRAERVAAHPGFLVEEGDPELRGAERRRVDLVHHPVTGAGQVGECRAADHDRKHREQRGDQDADREGPPQRPARGQPGRHGPGPGGRGRLGAGGGRGLCLPGAGGGRGLCLPGAGGGRGLRLLGGGARRRPGPLGIR